MDLIHKKYYAFHDKNGFYLTESEDSRVKLKNEFNDLWMDIDELINHYEWIIDELRKYKDMSTVEAQKNRVYRLLDRGCDKQIR